MLSPNNPSITVSSNVEPLENEDSSCDEGSVTEHGASFDTDNDMSFSSDTSVSSQSDLKAKYEAESPDELALVQLAYEYGCRLLHRTTNVASVALPGR